jgi:hypothetical protein
MNANLALHRLPAACVMAHHLAPLLALPQERGNAPLQEPA